MDCKPISNEVSSCLSKTTSIINYKFDYKLPRFIATTLKENSCTAEWMKTDVPANLQW